MWTCASRATSPVRSHARFGTKVRRKRRSHISSDFWAIWMASRRRLAQRVEFEQGQGGKLQRPGMQFAANAPQIAIVHFEDAAVGLEDASAKLSMGGRLQHQFADPRLQSVGKAEEHEQQPDRGAGNDDVAGVLGGANLAHQLHCQLRGLGERNDAIGAGLTDRCVDRQDRCSRRTLRHLCAIEVDFGDHVTLKGSLPLRAGGEESLPTISLWLLNTTRSSMQILKATMGLPIEVGDNRRSRGLAVLA